MTIETPRRATDDEVLLFPEPGPRPKDKRRLERHDKEELQRAKNLIDIIDQSEFGVAAIEVNGPHAVQEAYRTVTRLRHYCQVLGCKIQVHEITSDLGHNHLLLVRSAISPVESLNEV